MNDDLVKSLKLCGTSLQPYVNDCVTNHDGCCEAEPTCMYELMRKAADAIEDLSEQLENETEYATALNSYVPQWIPVTERVPKGADKSGELCENVWLFFDDGNVYPGWMNGITEKVYYLDNYSGSLMTAPISRVKMWQPRPEPPKVET